MVQDSGATYSLGYPTRAPVAFEELYECKLNRVDRKAECHA